MFLAPPARRNRRPCPHPRKPATTRPIHRAGRLMGKSETVQARHVLPALPYSHEALEPHIDARTMMLHHDKHHASYVEKLNAALEKHPELQERSAIWLLLNPRKVPDAIRTAVANNAGGHVNHSMFWRAMAPNGGGE